MFLLSGTVFPIMCKYTVHCYTMHISLHLLEPFCGVSMLMFPCIVSPKAVTDLEDGDEFLTTLEMVSHCGS